MRTDQKTIRQQTYTPKDGLASNFNKDDFDAAIKSKGYDCIYEKAYRCPCKGKASASLSNCKNCAGTGWFWANPIQTRMVIHSISSERKYDEDARKDIGMVQVSAMSVDKLSRMDRISVLKATSEHTEVVFPNNRNDNSHKFFYTKYDIKYIDYIGLYEGVGVKVKRLVEGTDYTFTNNIISLGVQYNNLVDPSVTIRYGHAPVFYIWNISRDSMESYVTFGKGETLINLPVHAIAKRAHLVKDAENFAGTMLLDNSWLPGCEDPGLDSFVRKLKYSNVVTGIWDNLTSTQKTDLQAYIDSLP